MVGVRWAVTLNILCVSLCKGSDLLSTHSYCGFQHSDDYVRDNERISIDEFPWIARLLYDEEKTVRCVGSLINSRYVLTAAQCLRNTSLIINTVQFGDYDVTTDKDCTNHTKFGEECSDPVQEFEIEEVIQHPDYDLKTSENDIGLIRLSKKVQYSEYIRPICLPASSTFELKDEEQLIVSGWGRVDFGEDLSTIKKKIIGKLIPYETCLSLYKKSSKPVTVNHLCVSEDETIFTCHGDGGSPLMKSIKSQWYQVGIVSFGKGCGNYFPSVYTKVTSYLDWIKETVRA